MCRSHYQIFTINIWCRAWLPTWKVYSCLERWPSRRTQSRIIMAEDSSSGPAALLLQGSGSARCAACPTLVRSVSTLECWPSLICHNGRKMCFNRNLRLVPQRQCYILVHWLPARPHLSFSLSPDLATAQLASAVKGVLCRTGVAVESTVTATDY